MDSETCRINEYMTNAFFFFFLKEDHAWGEKRIWNNNEYVYMEVLKLNQSYIDDLCGALKLSTWRKIGCKD